MQLLLRRHIFDPQIAKLRFVLWAKFELSPEEAQLLVRYKAQNGYLTVEFTWRDLWRSLFLALISGFVMLVILGAIPSRVPIPVAVVCTFVTFVFAWYIIYEQLRVAIRISDMLAGRNFRHVSLVLMARRERRMIGYAHAFILFLEKLKQWEGTEVIEIGEEHEPALRLVTDTYAPA